MADILRSVVRAARAALSGCEVEQGIEAAPGRAPDPVVRLDREQAAELDALTCLLPHLSVHAVDGCLAVVQAATRQPPVARHMGLGVELRQQQPPSARHDRVCRDALVGLADLLLPDARVTGNAFPPRTCAVQLAHAVAQLEPAVVTHRREERRLDGPPRGSEDDLRMLAVAQSRLDHTPVVRVDRDDDQAAGHVRPHRRTRPSARSYSATASAATCDHSCSGGWVVFQALIRATSPGSLARRAIADDICESLDTTRPFTPSVTNSPTPEPDRPMTGSPTVRASRDAIPNDSRRAGDR